MQLLNPPGDEPQVPNDLPAFQGRTPLSGAQRNIGVCMW